MDAIGNFTEVTTDKVALNSTHDLQNRLTGVDSTPLTYDANGNLIEDDQELTYTYDAWNRMIGVSEPEARYWYDALGRRVREASHTLIYSQNWQVIQERVGNGVIRQYVWSPVYVDALVAHVEYQDTDAVGALYVLQDANFNVTALVNGAGEVVERFIYDPYGRFEVLDDEWDPKSDSDYDWVYLHQGGRWDEAAELYNFRHRDYSPRLMRWVEQDPLGFDAGDSDLYRYVGNSAPNMTDPYGEEATFALGGNTVFGPREKQFNPQQAQGAFGGFDWLYAFNINPASSDKGGVILQLVSIVFDLEAKTANGWKVVDGTKETREYLNKSPDYGEYWAVKKNSNSSDVGLTLPQVGFFNDNFGWAWLGLPGRSIKNQRLKGEIAWYASAIYLDCVTPADMIKLGYNVNNQTGAGRLPSKPYASICAAWMDLVVLEATHEHSNILYRSISVSWTETGKTSISPAIVK